jgi:outer membrane protein assembly factor BamB/calcineurin-like phosphoesterase family protein
MSKIEEQRVVRVEEDGSERWAWQGQPALHRRAFLGAAVGSLASVGTIGSLIGAAPAASAAELGTASTGGPPAPLAFAVVSDTHMNVSNPAATSRLALVHRAIAERDPAFVLHCGDITDTGLPDEYELFAQTLPDALHGKIHYVPGNHEIRWDVSAKEEYHRHFGPAPYSFDAGGIHFIGFDPTQPLQEPGHFGAQNLGWLATDLRGVRNGTPSVLFQHYPMGDDFYYVDDQDRFFDLVAEHDVRGVFAGHVHRDLVRSMNGLTQIAVDAVRNGAMFYWVEKATGDGGAPVLQVTRVDVAADGSETSRAITTVTLGDTGQGGEQRPRQIRVGDVQDGRLPVDVLMGPAVGVRSVGCHVYPQQVFGGTFANTWTDLAATGPGRRWAGTVDVSALAPGTQRLQVRVTGPDGAFWEQTERFAVPHPSNTPRKAWEHRMHGSVQGGLSLLGDAVVAASTVGEVVALRPEADGDVSPLWRAAIGPVYRKPGVAADGSLLFVPSADHHLYALDARHGRIRWAYHAGAPVLSSPLVTRTDDRETVLFTAGDTLAAVDAASGKRIWAVAGHGFFAGQPAGDGARVYTGDGDGRVRAFTAATGEEIWSRQLVTGDEHRRLLSGPWDDTILPADGVVIVATVSATWALDQASGAQRWSLPGSTMYAPAELLEGTPLSILLITEFGIVSRIELSTGKIVWQTALGIRVMNSGAALRDATAWVQSVDGQLIGVDLDTGQIGARLQHGLTYCFSTPVTAGDLVIAADQDAVVRGIRVV